MSFLAALLPALISGGLGAASAFTSKKPGLKKIPTMSGQQQGVQNQLLQQLQGLLGQGGGFGQAKNYFQGLLGNDQQSRQDYEAPEMRRFKEQTIPGLTSLFGGLGAGSSSAFQNALGQAGAGLSENLQALRSQHQGNAANQLAGLPSQLLGHGMQSPFAYMQTQGGGGLSNILGSFGQGLSPGLGQLSGLAMLKNFFPGGFGR
jgi:hypothetical protein